MKIQYLLPVFLIGSLIAQEVVIPRATLLDPIIRDQVAKSPPKSDLQLDVRAESILKTKTLQHEGQKITLQQIEPIALPPIPPPQPTPPLSAEQLAARVALAEKAPKHRSVMLSCTIYEDRHTLIRSIAHENNASRSWEAWSNVNFRYFKSISRFEKNGIIYDLFLETEEENAAKNAARRARFGTKSPNTIDIESTEYALPEIPKLPANAATELSFIVSDGNPTTEDLTALIGLHEIYQDHHKDLMSEFKRIELLQNREAAARLANTQAPKPDIIIQHWKMSSDAKAATTKGGEE